MNKKSAFILPLFSLLAVSCGNGYSASPEMKAFFSSINANSAYSSLSSGKSSSSYLYFDGNGKEKGSIETSFEFIKGASEYYYYETKKYTGNEIVGGVESYTKIGIKEEDGTYKYQISTNGTLKEETTMEGNVETDIRDKIYVNNGSYNTGGLYYGDIFMVNSNTFPNDAFVIDSEKKTMSFVYKYAKAFTNDSNQKDYIQIDEDTCMDQNGLVIYSNEEISFDVSSEKGSNHMTASYNVEIEKKSL